MKIEFTDHETVAKIQEKGLYLSQCMHCNKYVHSRNNCPDMDHNLKLCSECGANVQRLQVLMQKDA